MTAESRTRLVVFAASLLITPVLTRGKRHNINYTATTTTNNPYPAVPDIMFCGQVRC